MTVGILAHVDAGKTTLSEQLLYRAGAIRSAGRVDHGNTVMDTDPVEKERGITVFSGQAELETDGCRFTLIDTPGHVDFSAEAERSMTVLDYAILLIDGSDGVRAHTKALFGMACGRGIPVIFFLNKNDLPGFDRDRTLMQIRETLSAHPVMIVRGDPDGEALAEADDTFCEQYLSGEADPEDAWRTLVCLTKQRRVCPVLEGAAVQGAGVEELLQLLKRFSEEAGSPDEREPFCGRVYAVRHEGNARVTFLRVLKGTLKPRQSFPIGDSAEKINQVRRYMGFSFRQTEEAGPGDTAGVTGLITPRPGDLLTADGIMPGDELKTRPVLAAQVDGERPELLHEKLMILNDEDPSLAVFWDQERHRPIVHIMGSIQTEILTRLLSDRFQLQAKFLPPQVLYRETIQAPVIGCGHYEPLRHYAEVRLRLEPGPRGSGITFESHCHEDMLDRNFQRLIRTHVFEKEHRGVLTGAPLTDVRVVLLAGRDHLKHTEGGDFREATCRAIRQGLMKAESILLEPCYRFTVTVPSEMTGRVLNDMTSLHCEYEAPETAGSASILRGRGPVSCLMGYPTQLRSFTHGAGDIQLEPDGYAPCHNAAQVIAEADYRPEADQAHPAGSVFCSHGAGYYVPWDEADAMMHIHEKDCTEVPPREL